MNQKNEAADEAEQEQPFVSHLVELRDRLLHIVAAIGLVFLCLVYFSNDIYTFIAAPTRNDNWSYQTPSIQTCRCQEESQITACKTRSRLVAW